jgi:hypothetical protein
MWHCTKSMRGWLPRIPEPGCGLIQPGEQLLKVCHVCSSSAWFRLRCGFAAQAGAEIARCRSDPASPEPVEGWRWPRFTAAARARRGPDRRRLGVQIVCDRLLRFNAGGPDGLLNGKPPGPSILDGSRRPALRQAVEEAGSRPWRRALAPHRSGAMGL